MQILKGVNLSQDKTIKDHNSLILKALTELTDYVEQSEDFNNFDFKNNLVILQRCYEMLERKLLI